MNLHHLYIFCVVAENKSFAKAAAKVNISQPAISQQVQKLEANLGKKLIERKGRLFRLTTHGETLFEYGRRIFYMVEEAENAVLRFGYPRKRIFLGATSITGTYFLPAFIAKFTEMNPYVQFNVSLEEHTNVLLENIIKNEIDIAITYETVILKDDIQVSRIIQDEFVLVLPGNHPWASGQLVSLEEIVTLPFIFYNQDHFIQPILESALSGSSVNVTLQLSQLEAVKNAIYRGLGVSMLPLSSIRVEVDHGLLAVANCPAFQIPKYLVSMHKKMNHLPDLIELALNCLKDKNWVNQL
jgi:DNA-binding transcriptional LysR family regulator